jgi:hypothetical protein
MTRSGSAARTPRPVGAGEVRDRLRRWQEETGISYVSLFDPGEEQITYLAERVLPVLGGPA